MSRGGLPKLMDQFRARLESQFSSRAEADLQRNISPIETLFRHAMIARAMADYLIPSEPLLGFIMPETWQAAELEYMRISVGDQVRVLDWPVDFLLATQDLADRRYYAVVECDGHDFHERTKAQAARDRSRDRRLQEAGFRVFRFTGSEIFNDPLKCADEVWAWAETIWDEGLPG